ncbi:MAG TPA: hypothetical protein PL059_06215 [Spirochaetota bacterium]|nr:hypothetical protein [Spirochaetota bacterium]HOM09693.1 hypothetical protein [Spirochaetota bacterium]HPP49559.1 hypothetical protein [Spirochaetota bacterium]HXK66318.1 hypothetical protein [Spirochaetota bacterium]
MIETILYILSFGAGIAVFLYLLSLYHHIKERPKPDNKQPAQKVTQDKIQFKSQPVNEPVHLKERTCPVCGSKLSKYEALYASKIVKDSTKILIYGCRYCYKPQEDPDKKKKSDI